MHRPTEAQKEAGNYAMDRVRLHGLPITIENRKGTIRRGTSKSGHDWSVVLPYHYGYIRRTLGADGDQVDVFLGPNRASQFCVVVNQHDRQTGVFDEVKVGLGYDSLEQAKAAYRQGYRGRNVPRATFKPTTIQRLKEWLGTRQTLSGYDFNAGVRLTDFESGMKRTIQFRREQEEKPSLARRVMSVAAPVAIIGGTLAYKHYTRPSVPTKAVNPAAPPPRMRAEPRQQVIGQLGNPRSTEWLTKAENDGAAPRPKKSIFYQAPAASPKFNHTPPVAPVVKMPGAAKAPVKAPAAPAKKKTPANNTGTGKRRLLSALLKLVEFNPQNEVFNNMMGASDRVATAYRTGRRIVPWVKRGGQVAEDSADIASGKKVKDPFYKKAWFKAGAMGAAIGAPILAARKINAWHQQDTHFPNSVAAMSPKTGQLKEKILRGARKVDAKWVASKKGRVPLLTHDKDPFFSSKIKNPILLQAVVNHLKNFDLTADERGWDLRDARGKSARVYAPGSKRRVRRDKTWDEKTDNIRATRNVAAVAAAGGLAGTLIFRNKANAANATTVTATEAARKKARDQVVAGVKRARAQAKFLPSARSGLSVISSRQALAGRVLTTDLKAKVPALHRLAKATAANVQVPTPSLPGSGAVEYISGLPPKRRASVLRVLGAGTVAGGGTLAGVLSRRPKTGALLGGLGAGLILK
jgi:hypothetical protein